MSNPIKLLWLMAPPFIWLPLLLCCGLARFMMPHQEGGVHTIILSEAKDPFLQKKGGILRLRLRMTPPVEGMGKLKSSGESGTRLHLF